MNPIRTIVVAAALAVTLSTGALAQDDGGVVLDPPVSAMKLYLPLIVSTPALADNEILITLVDTSAASILPVTITVMKDGKLIWYVTRTEETSWLRIWNMVVETDAYYQINWWSKAGDVCTFYQARFEKKDHLSILDGHCRWN